MPTTSARRSRLVVGWVALAVCLSSCSLLGDDAPERKAAPVAISDAPTDVVAGIQGALEARSTAIREGREPAFTRGLVRDAGFRNQQATYFANLAQLPLSLFDYTFDPADLVREGDSYWVVVHLQMQLTGYDALPVTSVDRFRFQPAGASGRFRLASVTDGAWESQNEIQPQPWDTEPIRVRVRPGVLGIFDAGSVGQARPLMVSVAQGIAAVSGVVPYAWSRSVVVYALSDTSFLSTIQDLPGGDPEELDGVAFPVMSEPGGTELAATRFILHPRMLTRPGPGRERLVRHELTHVALGERDDDAPIWLSEGLAEYVSVYPLAPEDRNISARAVDAARAGIRDLPPDAGFNDAESPVHYGIAWWACEYVAGTYGPSTLWALLDAFDRPGKDQQRVLRGLVGVTTRQLARKAAHLMLATFDPASLEPPPPSDLPTVSPSDLDPASPATPTDQPSGTPSASPS